MSTELRAKVDRGQTTTAIVLTGVLDERAQQELAAAFADPRGTVSINFRGVARINSSGIGLLMKHLSRLARAHAVEFLECSGNIVDQFQMLDFAMYGRIKSLYLRYSCAVCGTKEEKLIHVDGDIHMDRDGRFRAAESTCVCGGRSAVDESLDFIADHVDR